MDRLLGDGEEQKSTCLCCPRKSSDAEEHQASSESDDSSISIGEVKFKDVTVMFMGELLGIELKIPVDDFKISNFDEGMGTNQMVGVILTALLKTVSENKEVLKAVARAAPQAIAHKLRNASSLCASCFEDCLSTTDEYVHVIEEEAVHLAHQAEHAIEHTFLVEVNTGEESQHQEEETPELERGTRSTHFSLATRSSSESGRQPLLMRSAVSDPGSQTPPIMQKNTRNQPLAASSSSQTERRSILKRTGSQPQMGSWADLSSQTEPEPISERVAASQPNLKRQGSAARHGIAASLKRTKSSPIVSLER